MCNIKRFCKFGTITGAGFTLPDAFDIIERYAAGKCYVVNVLDTERHCTTITDEVLELDSNTLTAKTIKPGLLTISITADGHSLTEGDDYTVVLQTGDIKFKTNQTALKATYTYADPTKVTENDIKGGVDSLTGKRKGFELLRDGFNLYGADAKI
ncbi:Uncharacterised protein [Actinobacillus equuli]|nr:Uncharacterised protein [Actinobacillus equuli]